MLVFDVICGSIFLQFPLVFALDLETCMFIRIGILKYYSATTKAVIAENMSGMFVLQPIRFENRQNEEKTNVIVRPNHETFFFQNTSHVFPAGVCMLFI